MHNEDRYVNGTDPLAVLASGLQYRIRESDKFDRYTRELLWAIYLPQMLKAVNKLKKVNKTSK